MNTLGKITTVGGCVLLAAVFLHQLIGYEILVSVFKGLGAGLGAVVGYFIACGAIGLGIGTAAGAARVAYRFVGDVK